MDREQEEMQFLGLFGSFKESFKLIQSCRKIFAQISLALILPLSFMFLLHIDLSDTLFAKITTDKLALDQTEVGTPGYGELLGLLSKEWMVFLLFKAAFFTFFLVLSLLSTSAVVYTIACVYTSQEVTFYKVLTVVPRVWKRLIVTFLCIFFAVFLYNALAVALFVAIFFVLGGTTVGAVAMLVLAALFLAGLVYMSVVWQLASVVSVLEEDYGMKAMSKSKDLIKGKVGLSVAVLFTLASLLGFVQVMFRKLVVVQGATLGTPAKVGFGILCVAVLSGIFLFGLTIRTVIYFICKSYHHESIDKSALSDHLQVYVGEYVPLKENDVQLHHYQV